MARGRPRQFDRDQALVQAMDLFWRRGYQDTSIGALTEHMGIASPSLYAAFGSKAALFREAADRYQAGEAARPAQELETDGSGRDAVERMLRANVELFTRRGGPRGCLLTRAVVTCPAEEREVRSYLDRSSRERVRALERRLHRARSAGEALPSDDVGAMAQLYDALVQGLAIRAAEGASRQSLQRAVDLAMASWDGLARAGVNQSSVGPSDRLGRGG